MPLTYLFNLDGFGVGFLAVGVIRYAFKWNGLVEMNGASL